MTKKDDYSLDDKIGGYVTVISCAIVVAFLVVYDAMGIGAIDDGLISVFTG